MAKMSSMDRNLAITKCYQDLAKLVEKLSILHSMENKEMEALKLKVEEIAESLKGKNNGNEDGRGTAMNLL